MGYVYRGKNRDVTKPAPAPVRPASTPGPKPQPHVFDPSRCGTYAGYKQHEKTGTEKCQPCKDANSAYSRDYAARRKTGHIQRQGFQPDACGTRNGYLRHRRHKVPVCAPCAEACRAYSAAYRAKTRKQTSNG